MEMGKCLTLGLGVGEEKLVEHTFGVGYITNFSSPFQIFPLCNDGKILREITSLRRGLGESFKSINDVLASLPPWYFLDVK